MDPQSSLCLTLSSAAPCSVTVATFVSSDSAPSLPFKELTRLHLSSLSPFLLCPGSRLNAVTWRNHRLTLLLSRLFLLCSLACTVILCGCDHSLLVLGERINLVPATPSWPIEEIPIPIICNFSPPSLLISWIYLGIICMQ